jgi:hypothetical protein
VFWGLLACGSKNNQQDSGKAGMMDKFEGVRKNLVGKKAAFVEGIGSTSGSGQIVYYYTGFDCGTCVEKGIESVKALESVGYEPIVMAFQTNIGQDQLYYGYEKRIWVDQRDALHDSFHFIPTPFFLIIDEGLRVIDVHFPQNLACNPDSARFFSHPFFTHNSQ